MEAVVEAAERASAAATRLLGRPWGGLAGSRCNSGSPDARRAGKLVRVGDRPHTRARARALSLALALSPGQEEAKEQVQVEASQNCEGEPLVSWALLGHL